MDNLGITVGVDQQGPRRLGRHHQGLSSGGAGPRDRRHLRPPVHHHHADGVPLLPAGGAVTVQVGRGYLVGRECRAADAIRAHQSVLRFPCLIHHSVERYPFGPARNPQRQRLNEKGRLLLRQPLSLLLRYRTTGFHPYLLPQAILRQQATVEDGEVVDTLRLVVNIQRQDVKVEAMSAGLGVSRQRVQKAADEGGIALEDVGPVGYTTQVNDGARVRLPGCRPCRAQESGEIRRRPGPVLRSVRPLPDHPVVNPARVLPDHRPHEGRPEVFGVIGGSLQAPGQAGDGVSGPGGDAGQHAHHLTAQGEFQGQLLIGEGWVPVGGAVGLNIVPAERDEGPASPQVGGCPGGLMGRDDAEAGVGRAGSPPHRCQQAEEEGRDQKENPNGVAALSHRNRIRR